MVLIDEFTHDNRPDEEATALLLARSFSGAAAFPPIRL
jgi:hypothetical protein